MAGNAMRTIRLYTQNQALRARVEASLLPYVGMDSPRFTIYFRQKNQKVDERVSARLEPCQDRNWQMLPDETAGEYYKKKNTPGKLTMINTAPL